MLTSCLACGTLMPVGKKGRCEQCKTQSRKAYEYNRARQPHRQQRGYNTAAWRKARAAAIANSAGRCRHCGTDHDLTVHHIDHDRTNHEQANLIALCRSCHARLERLEDRTSN